MNRVSRLIAAVFLVALTAAPAAAQADRLTGHVSDPRGAGVANASVVLTSAGPTYAVTTNQYGDFAIDQVAPGTYSVEVEAQGFALWKESVRILVLPRPLNITLKIAGVREAVDVVGAAGMTLAAPAETGSRLGLSPMDTPASVSVLPGESVREHGTANLNDAKARAVGVTMQGNPGNGFNGLASRGFVDSSSVMQLFDGTLMQVGAMTVTFPFDPWMVDRIEVLGGPASVMYGNGAIGGVVNVVPRRPTASKGTTVRFAGGSFDTWRGAADTSGAIGTKTSYRLDFSANRSGGWLKDTPSDSTAFSASVLHEFSPTLELTVSEDFGYQRPGNYFGSPTVDGVVDRAHRDVNYNVSDSNIWFRDSWTMAKVEWRPSPNVRVTNRPRVLIAGRHFRDVEEYVVHAVSDVVLRDSYFEAFHRQRQYGDDTEVVFSNRLFGRSNTLSAGFDYNFVSFQHTNNSPYGGASVTDLDNSTPGTFINLAGTVPKYRTHTNQASPYAEDRFVLAPKVSLVGGVRLDTYSVERTNLLDGSTADRTYTPVSWRGGAVYAVKPELSLYGQVATATDTVRNIISSNPAQLLFDPTVGRQVEGGVKQSLLDHRAEWTVAGYYIRKTKLLAPVPGSPGVQQQIGAQSSRGVEATAAINLPAGLRIEGNVAVLDARFDDFSENVNGTLVSRVGNTPPSVPEHSVNLWLTWNGPNAWQFRGGIRSVGRRYWDNANTSTIPAYTVLDAGLQKRLAHRVAVDLYLFNLTDKLYGTDVYFNAFTPQWMLGVPRSAEVALTVGF